MNPESQRPHFQLEQETVNRYTEIANAYNSDWRGKNDELQLAFLTEFESLVGHPPRIILDVGCGTGKDSVEFSTHGYSVVSLDLSEGMLSEALENAHRKRTLIKPTLANMETIPLESESIDGIWNMASFVHIPTDKRRKVLEEFYRVLKPEGILHMGVQNLLASKHLKRIIQSYLCELGYNDQNQFYIRQKSLPEIISGPSLFERFKNGYAFLDRRHWFYPTKPCLIRLLQEQGFSIIVSNQAFARRLRIFAKK